MVSVKAQIIRDDVQNRVELAARQERKHDTDVAKTDADKIVSDPTASFLSRIFLNNC